MRLTFIKRWIHHTEASTAIEFSLLFIPYLLLTLAIIEVSMMYASASLLEGATNSAARLIKTGQLQQMQGVDPAVAFKQALCKYANVLVKCNEVVIEVIPMNNFTDYASLQPKYDNNGNMISKGFNAGGTDSKILVRTSYRYHMITPMVGPLLAGASGKVTFISTIVIQNEPYLFGAKV